MWFFFQLRRTELNSGGAMNWQAIIKYIEQYDCMIAVSAVYSFWLTGLSGLKTQVIESSLEHYTSIGIS